MPDRPNILLITCDQLRWDCLGANGNQRIMTPNIDRLAREGVNFQCAYSPNPICVPARASMITGRHLHQVISGSSNGAQVNEGVTTLPECLNQHGYRTAALGKLHFLPYAKPRTLHGLQHVELCEEGRILDKEKQEGVDLGGEDYHDDLHAVGYGGYERAHGIGNNDVHVAPSALPKEHYISSWVRRRSLAWLDDHLGQHADQPFFLWSSFVRPHAPFDPPEPYHRLYDPRDMPTPIEREAIADKSPILRIRERCYGWDRMCGPEVIQNIRAHYYGLVTFIDHQIGLLLDELERRGLADHTLVIFTADHGEFLGDFGAFFKTSHLEPSGRIPFIVRDRGTFTGGGHSDALVSLMDLFPTIASAANLEHAPALDGLALNRVLQNDQSPREHLVCHTLDQGYHTYMVRDPRWKYIYNEYAGHEELYDLTNDPQERTNLANHEAHADRCRAMHNDLIAWCQRIDDQRTFDGQRMTARQQPLDELVSEPTKRQGWRWY